MTRRYFVPDLPSQAGRVELSVDEAAHAARVMRVSVGDSAVLFDGRGRHADGMFCEVGKKKVVVEFQQPEEHELVTFPRIHIGVSLPKGDRAKWLVEKLTELGVQTLLPVDCQFMQNTHGHNESSLEKLRRVVIEACKQCGQNRLLTIEPKSSFNSFCDRAAIGSRAGQHWLFADPSAQTTFGDYVKQKGSPTTLGNPTERTDWWIIIGPEGGFSPEELEAADHHGWTGVGLGESILRIETAAIAMAARLVLE